MRLDDKVMLITGGSSGQGRAEVELFVAVGGTVVSTDVVEAPGGPLDGTTSLHLDVSNPADWDAAIAKIVSRHGRLDVLVNNAGIFGVTPIIDGNPDEFLKVVMINQFGTYLGMRACAPVIAQAGGGSIINISSVGGLMGLPRLSAYVGSKFAVRGMTKCAAIELGELGIRVNSVHPGYIDTPMLRRDFDAEQLASNMRAAGGSVPAGRVGSAEEVAQLVAFLASDDSSYCTGAEFVVDGGQSAGFKPYQ